MVTAGAGTLIFQLITRRTVPVFLASSFAFIATIIYGTQTFGLPGTMCGLAAAGLFYAVISGVIAMRGPDIVNLFMPPLVTGPVIIVIGLNLAPVAVNMALGKSGDGAFELFPMTQALTVSMLALTFTIVATVFGRGLFKLIPIFCGIAAGYAVALFLGMVNFQPDVEAT